RPALQALCVDLGERVGIEIDCRLGETADALSPALAETVWRITQEALTNVEKHAQARRIQVVLECEPDTAILSVIDDGIGLPAHAETNPNHFGLKGMRERAERLGGTLTLHGDENGTVVKARLPIGAAAAQPVPASGEMPVER
ncbi:MAG: histidine kinase, partial [Anaerolineae bacterium]|nr:histidine kinase [Anaerolineae bacterium]